MTMRAIVLFALHVTLAAPAGTKATIHAKRLDATAAAVEMAVAAPGALDLPDGVWEVRATAPRTWAAPLFTSGESSTLRLFRLFDIHGTAMNASALRVQFSPVERDGAAGEVDCRIDGTAWTCGVPEGRYDLRFASPKNAPEYRFGVDVAHARAFDLRFVAGASLSGRVEPLGRTRAPVADVEVALSAGSDRRIAKSDARGWFQFKGLAPGNYTATARKGRFVSQERQVNVVAGLAAELRDPLLLDTPKQLTVMLTPPAAPDGTPWRVQLLTAADRRSRRMTLVAEAPASPSGEWVRTGVVSGDYEILIARANGQRWKMQPVTIGDADAMVPVSAFAMHVEGDVTLGDRPLQASLAFDDEWGTKLQSDEQGRFEGDIPNAGDAKRRIRVDSETPGVHRTLTEKIPEGRLSIHLPATTLTGRVVTDDHTPVSHAWVAVSRDQVFEQTSTAEDGGFQISGFEPGNYHVTADAPDASSSRVDVDLRDGDTTEIEIVVHKQLHVRGRVTANEMPVIAADVYAFPRDSWTPTLPHVSTNEAGVFQLDLPAATTTFDGIAVSPAFDIVMSAVTVQNDRPLHVRMHQIGGTLTVDCTTAAGLLLVHSGAEVPLGWIAMVAEGSAAAPHVTVPRLEPGHYSVCSRASRKCASGYLPPFGTLTLSP